MRRQVLELQTLRNGIYAVLVRRGMNRAGEVRSLMRATKFARSPISLLLVLLLLLLPSSSSARPGNSSNKLRHQRRRSSNNRHPQRRRKLPSRRTWSRWLPLCATRKGEIISNLTKDDFALDEDGRPQTVSYFARENDLPLTVGFAGRHEHEPATPDRSGTYSERDFRRSRAARK